VAIVDPRVPQVNDPELEVALIRALSILGPVGKLNVSDTVIPVVNLVDVRTPTILVETPAFLIGEQFGGGSAVAPVNSFDLADTGPLAAGTYDIVLAMGASGNANDAAFAVRHRNDADTATLTSFDIPLTGGTGFSMTYATVFAQSERLKVEVLINTAAGERWAASIFAKRRS